MSIKPLFRLWTEFLETISDKPANGACWDEEWIRIVDKFYVSFTVVIFHVRWITAENAINVKTRFFDNRMIQ